MNRSLVFGIPASTAPSKSILMYENTQNCKTARKMAGNPALSPYTKAILHHIAECCSRVEKVLPPQKYLNCILTLEDLPRTTRQKEIENTIKAVSTNIICYGSSDLRRDSAALWAMSDLMQDLDSGKILKADEKNVTEYLLCCLKCCRIPCAIVSPSQKLALSGDENTNKQNSDNLNFALLNIGFTDVNHPAVVKTRASLMAGAGVVPVEDIEQQLLALGIEKDPLKSIMMKTILKKSLGTYYPIQLVWPEFPFGTGTGGGRAGLGAEATATDKMAEAFANALPSLLSTTNNLISKYGEAKIAQMNQSAANELKQVMQQSTGQSANTISTEQLAAFAAQNQAAAEAAVAKAAEANKVEIEKLKLEQDKKSKTFLYAGIGAGALLLTFVAISALRK